MAAEVLQPMVVDEASLGFAAMVEAGPGGHFFGTAHTLERYERAFYEPMLSDRPGRQPSSSSPSAGSQNPNSAPLPSRGRAQMRPPMPSTSWRHTKSPIPAPDARRAASGAR